MDSLLVDLDKVLDDFEAEEKAATLAPGQELKPSGFSEYLEQHDEAPWKIMSEVPVTKDVTYSTNGEPNEGSYNVMYDVPYEPTEKFDLSEADFAPSPPSVVSKIHDVNSLIYNVNKESDQNITDSVPVYNGLSSVEEKNLQNGKWSPRPDSSGLNSYGSSTDNSPLKYPIQAADLTPDVGVNQVFQFNGHIPGPQALASPDRQGFEGIVPNVQYSTDQSQGRQLVKPELQYNSDGKNSYSWTGGQQNQSVRDRSVNQPVSDSFLYQSSQHPQNSEVVHRPPSDGSHFVQNNYSELTKQENNSSLQIVKNDLHSKYSTEQDPSANTKTVNLKEHTGSVYVTEVPHVNLEGGLNQNVAELNPDSLESRSSHESRENSVSPKTDYVQSLFAQNQIKLSLTLDEGDELLTVTTSEVPVSNSVSNVKEVVVEDKTLADSGLENLNQFSSEKEEIVGFDNTEVEVTDMDMEQYLKDESSAHEHSQTEGGLASSPNQVPTAAGNQVLSSEAVQLDAVRQVPDSAGSRLDRTDIPHITATPGKETIIPKLADGCVDQSHESVVLGQHQDFNISDLEISKVLPVERGPTRTNISENPSLSHSSPNSSEQVYDSSGAPEQAGSQAKIEEELPKMSGSGTGARPKELTPNKVNRPSTLLGLSTVSLDSDSPFNVIRPVPNNSVSPDRTNESSGHLVDVGQGQQNQNLIQRPENVANIPEVSPGTPYQNVDSRGELRLTVGEEFSVNMQTESSTDDHIGKEDGVSSSDVLAHSSQVPCSGELTDELEPVAMRRPQQAQGEGQNISDSFLGPPGPVPSRPHSWGPSGSGTPPVQRQKRPTSLNLPPRPDFSINGNGGLVAVQQSPVVEEVSPEGQPDRQPQEAAEASAVEDEVATASGEDQLPVVAEGACVPEQSSALDLSPPPAYSTTLGKVAPKWVPDAEAPVCMGCDLKFTFTKRRHHCRACGKVFCSTCCNMRSHLAYMDNKEARVCLNCHQDLALAELSKQEETAVRPHPHPNNPSDYCSIIPPSQQASTSAPPPMVLVPTGVLKRDAELSKQEETAVRPHPHPNNPSDYCSIIPSSQQSSTSAPPPMVLVPMGVLKRDAELSKQEETAVRPHPHPNNPSDYCSIIPSSQQSSTSAPPPMVLVPMGVLKRDGSARKSEPKQVMFSDGIRPGGDLTELDGSSEVTRTPPRRSRSAQKRMERASQDGQQHSPRSRRIRGVDRQSKSLLPDEGLPPIVLPSEGIELSLQPIPDPENFMPQIKSEEAEPVIFAVNPNLLVSVKIVDLDCCVNRVCWCFCSKGMCNVGQEEVVIVLEILPEEKTIPRDIFCHFHSLYEEASKGNTVTDMSHTIFNQSFLDSRDHGGFLYVRGTFQCLQKLILPEPPYVFGILLQKWETPWAKVFPIRLLLRLGAEYRYYPCPLIGVRNRKPVFFEIGHTIMNLLADFRNYQYMLPQIPGITIHMEDKKTLINFPRNRYDELMKVVNNSNEHVMAIGATFSSDADSHLVCIQNDDGNYQTQAINIQNKPRKVTGASFVVFNGALKTSSGLTAKSSIVEDGLMVQITPDSMLALKQAMKDMQDYTIACGTVMAAKPDEMVFVQWVDDDKNFNIGVKSPVDKMAMDGVESIRIHNSTDYVGEKNIIRWTEVFFIKNEDSGTARWEPVDLSRLGETLSSACCTALVRHLERLKEAKMTRIGLRVTIDVESVGYEIGSNGERLTDTYMNDLDNELIPVIHRAASQSQESPTVLELIFHILS